MGYEMAARLAKGGCDIAVWNRTRAKAEPLGKYGVPGGVAALGGGSG